MTDIAIRVQNLSKKYHIGASHKVDSLREQATEMVRGLLRRKNASPTSQENFIWALQDVSFEVKRGEILGIIGHNGAGKSTLLKILSRITRPTGGRVEIYGRVSSLLEVGTGFHPDLTGRENIYMNAVVLGMSRHEVQRKFDEIVEFAGIEKFIDTPVKRYSSGMQVRLGFSVAAHLEPDILIVDEVLTVGDAAFQKRSLGQMDNASQQGRTILFVSHNLGALSALCPRSILLDHGNKVMDDATHKVVDAYMQNGNQQGGERHWDDPQTAPGNEKVRLHSVQVICNDQVTTEVDIQKDVLLQFEFWNFKAEEPIAVSMHLFDSTGVMVFGTANLPSANLIEDDWSGKPFPPGLFRSTCTIPGNFLNTGRYSISFFVHSNITHIEAAALHVIAFEVYETGGMRKEYIGSGWKGVIRPRLAWQTEYLNPGEEPA